MSKIIITKKNNSIKTQLKDINCECELMDLLTTVLVFYVKELKTVENKKHFLKLMEQYYDETE